MKGNDIQVNFFFKENPSSFLKIKLKKPSLPVFEGQKGEHGA